MCRYLYYTDWGDEARVVRCQMDGSSCTVLLQGLQNPNSVAVDDSLLYIVDSRLKHRSSSSDTHSSTLIQLSATNDMNDTTWTATNLPLINVLTFILLLKSRHISRKRQLGGVRNYWGGAPFPLSPPLPFPSPSLPRPPLLFLPLPSPLEVGPLKSSLGAWGSAVSFPSGVWGGAPDEIEFSAF